MNLVDAIEEGKIVRVSEDYARREGLPILRKHVEQENIEILGEEEKKPFEDEVKTYGVEEYRKPLGWKEEQVISELIDNFQWHIAKTRRQINLTRKQLAEKIGIPEQQMKMIENGLIPGKDFVLVNKIQDILGINLRKDGQDFGESPRRLVDEEKAKKAEKHNLDGEDFEIIGSEIEVVEE